MDEYKLYNDDVVYRPPEEANSVLLEFSYGCSYSKCSFCHYSITQAPLMIADERHLSSRLEMLNAVYPDKKRIFLLGGNVLTYKAAFLLEIFGLINKYMPNIEEISMYARADDINSKSAESLKALKQNGLNTVYVGLESGDDKVLRLCNKGVSADEMLKAFGALDQAGIFYGLTSILGLGGKPLWREHAVNTGKLFSRCNPTYIRTLTLRAERGTKIYDDIENGSFVPLSRLEILYEQRLLMENINLRNTCIYVGDRDDSTKVSGVLPNAKSGIIELIDDTIMHFGE